MARARVRWTFARGSECREFASSHSPQVPVVRPIVRQVTHYVDFTGHLEAAQTAEVRARVTGSLAKVVFKPGTMVKQGDLLFEIDPAPFQAEVDKREATFGSRNSK